MAAAILFTPAEEALVTVLLAYANRSEDPKLDVLTADHALDIFGTSGLDDHVLAAIWDVSDHGPKGYLETNEAAVAVRLIGWAQQGEEVGQDLAQKRGPLAIFQSIPLENYLPTLDDDDVATYMSQFQQAKPQRRHLTREQVLTVLDTPTIPPQVLMDIIQLADGNNLGKISQAQFVLAMYFRRMLIDNTLQALPTTLPEWLMEKALEATKEEEDGLNLAFTSDFESVKYTFNVKSRTPPREVVDLADLYFKVLDSEETGVIDGDVALPFLMQSGLSAKLLSDIWDHADTDHTGTLSAATFAKIIFFIYRSLAGFELPKRAPPPPPKPPPKPLALRPGPGGSLARPRSMSAAVVAAAVPALRPKRHELHERSKSMMFVQKSPSPHLVPQSAPVGHHMHAQILPSPERSPEESPRPPTPPPADYLSRPHTVASAPVTPGEDVPVRPVQHLRAQTEPAVIPEEDSIPQIILQRVPTPQLPEVPSPPPFPIPTIPAIVTPHSTQSPYQSSPPLLVPFQAPMSMPFPTVEYSESTLPSRAPSPGAPPLPPLPRSLSVDTASPRSPQRSPQPSESPEVASQEWTDQVTEELFNELWAELHRRHATISRLQASITEMENYRRHNGELLSEVRTLHEQLSAARSSTETIQRMVQDDVRQEMDALRRQVQEHRESTAAIPDAGGDEELQMLINEELSRENASLRTQLRNAVDSLSELQTTNSELERQRVVERELRDENTRLARVLQEMRDQHTREQDDLRRTVQQHDREEAAMRRRLEQLTGNSDSRSGGRRLRRMLRPDGTRTTSSVSAPRPNSTSLLPDPVPPTPISSPRQQATSPPAQAQNEDIAPPAYQLMDPVPT